MWAPQKALPHLQRLAASVWAWIFVRQPLALHRRRLGFFFGSASGGEEGVGAEGSGGVRSGVEEAVDVVGAGIAGSVVIEFFSLRG